MLKEMALNFLMFTKLMDVRFLVGFQIPCGIRFSPERFANGNPHLTSDGSYLKSVDRFLLEPDVVARKIVKIIGKNKRELNLPVLLNLAHKFYTLFPSWPISWQGNL